MAYERYVAICHPLNYMIFMRPSVCWFIVGTTWILESVIALVFTIYTMHYLFCKSWQIRYLFCEIPSIAEAGLYRHFIPHELMVYLTSVSVLILPLAVILVSYV
jgi:olfactory receptor